MGRSGLSESFNFFPQNDQVCPLRRPHLCLGLFGVLLPRTLPLQTKNYNYNYTSTLQKAPQEGGPTRTLPTQTCNHNHNYNYSTTLQKIEEKRLPVSSHHQSQPVEASATYQALSSASITIRAAVAATIPMTAQPPSLSNVIFLLVPSLVGRYPDWYSVSEDMCAINIF